MHGELYEKVRTGRFQNRTFDNKFVEVDCLVVQALATSLNCGGRSVIEGDLPI